MIKITHLGHAGFLIENSSERLIIDPADESFGYKWQNEIVNYLLISHEHWDHNYIEKIELVKSNDSFRIYKIDSFHDNENGKLRGKNIIHLIETENIRICHLGDLGHILTEEQIMAIGHVDVLLIPVGGIYTINNFEAIEVVKQLNAQTVIPMHYQTDFFGRDKGLTPVEDFNDNIKGYEIVINGNNYIEYQKEEKKKVYVI